MAKSINYSYQTLKNFCVDAFQKFGFSASQAEIITESLLLADLYGIESHGIQRLSRYHTCIKRGMIHVEAQPEVVFETPVSAVIDGHEGMGQIISHKAINLAIEKAKKSGMAMVVVRNSNHYGIAGYYAKMAADQGFIGISSTNTEAICVPTYGKKAMLGTNPIAVAAPAEPYMFLFDASTSVVTRGKLRFAISLISLFTKIGQTITMVLFLPMLQKYLLVLKTVPVVEFYRLAEVKKQREAIRATATVCLLNI